MRCGSTSTITVRATGLWCAAVLSLAARTVVAETGGRPFPETFAASFRETFARLDDRTAALAARAILLSARTVANDLRWATPDQTGKTTVSLEDALTLLHVYQAVESYRGFAGLPAALVERADARRFAHVANAAVYTRASQ